MIMSEGALDLSISSFEVPSQRASRLHDQVSSDSGRASSDSTLSDVHDDVKLRLRSSPQVTPQQSHGGNNSIGGRIPGFSQFSPPTNLRDVSELPGHIQQTIKSSISPPGHSQVSHTIGFSNPDSPVQNETISGDDETKLLTEERVSDSRVAPIRPFKMYPVDPFNVYGNPLMAGAAGTLSPTPVSLHSLYDPASPVNFPSFPLTPLTSHLLQRKRRSENRDNSSSASTASASSTTINSSNSTCGNGNGSSLSGTGSSRVSTSSPVSSKEDSNGSDGEKRAKTSIDVKKDEAYWDRRRKNNEAAKRSRDARRQKEEEIAMRAAFLEQENLKLRAQVAILKNETAKLHYMLYNRI